MERLAVRSDAYLPRTCQLVAQYTGNEKAQDQKGEAHLHVEML
jgi:hypothetical protein